MKWTKPEPKHLELTKWKWLVSYPENLVIGENVDIGAFTYIQAKDGVVIEDNVQIGSHTSIYSVSTIDKKRGRVVLRRNSKIGSHSLIMPGVIVGKNSIIGAFSFIPAYVEIPENEVWTGIPAKKIKNIAESDSR